MSHVVKIPKPIKAELKLLWFFNTKQSMPLFAFGFVSFLAFHTVSPGMVQYIVIASLMASGLICTKKVGDLLLYEYAFLFIRYLLKKKRFIYITRDPYLPSVPDDARQKVAIKRNGYDLPQMALAIALTAMLSVGAYFSYEGLQNYNKKLANDHRINMVQNALITYIQNNSDLPRSCNNPSGSSNCVNGVGCTTAGFDFRILKLKYFDNMEEITMDANGNITNIQDFTYNLCPQAATGFAYASTIVNPSFSLTSWAGQNVKQFNFNP